MGQWQSPVGGQLAGWWYRVGATLIDGIILTVTNIILRVLIPNTGGFILETLVGAAYLIILVAQRGQTVGNMAVGTRVVDANTGGRVSYVKALVRWAVELVLIVLLFVPYILDVLWPLWDSQNQTLHDKAAGTVVLRT